MEVLSSTDISGEVIKLIDSARQSLVLVSAYFDPWQRLTTELRRAATRPGLKTLLLLRGGDDKAKHAERVAELEKQGLKVAYLDRLHAKIYLSERHAIITSMNLLKSSALDSWEIAVHLDRQTDATAYADLTRHVGELLRRAQDERSLPAPSPKAPALRASRTTTTRHAAAAPIDDDSGSCIRCGADIEFDPDRPLCGSCYREWSKWQNEDYEESFCHACGDKEATSMAKPLCRPCWKAL